ncbi:MAG: MerR family transcriptional regulator [Acidobacteriota bacterium]
MGKKFFNIDLEGKSFFKIDDISKYLNVDKEVINYWEETFPFINSKTNSDGEKLYDKKSIDIFFRINELLTKENLTLAGARRKLHEEIAKREKVESFKDKISWIKTELLQLLTTLKDKR